MNRFLATLTVAALVAVSACSKKSDDNANPTPSGNYGQVSLEGRTYKFTLGEDYSTSRLYVIDNGLLEGGRKTGVNVFLNLPASLDKPELREYLADSGNVLFYNAISNADGSGPYTDQKTRFFGRSGEKITVSKSGSTYKYSFTNLHEKTIFGDDTNNTAVLSGYVISESE